MQEFKVSALVAGAMPLSMPARPHEDAVRVLHHAFERGLTWIDTADVYAPTAEEIGHNERLVGEAVRRAPAGADAVRVVTKIGLRRSGHEWSRDGSPAWLRQAAEASNRALGRVPDVLCLHRVDRATPFEVQVEGLLAVHAAGLCRAIGLSNVDLGEYRTAQRLSGGCIALVQNERSPRYRGHTDVLEACTADGVPFLAWSPLGGGHYAARLGEKYPAFAEVGRALGATPQQVALAWLRATSSVLAPVVGFTRTASVDAAVDALPLRLTPEQVAALDAAPHEGTSLYPD
jgi:aryl-alcohol dehydrogenase-like predicted oxidoreductase